jgi:hypothetical protein
MASVRYDDEEVLLEIETHGLEHVFSNLPDTSRITCAPRCFHECYRSRRPSQGKSFSGWEVIHSRLKAEPHPLFFAKKVCFMTVHSHTLFYSFLFASSTLPLPEATPERACETGGEGGTDGLVFSLGVLDST